MQLSYCGTMTKAMDPERFFLSHFAPAKQRESLWALLAFNHEIAKTREVVSETQLGLIRLQWWREEIGKIYETKKAPENEILEALSVAIKAYDLPQSLFETLIYGREFDLEGVLPTNIDGALKYIEATNVPLMQLIGYVLGIKDVQDVAMNYGLIGLLRAIPFHSMQERCYLPENLLRDENVNEYTLYKGKETDAIIPIVQKMSQTFKIVTPKNGFMKATQIWADLYRKQLTHYNFDIFRMTNAPPPKFAHLRTAWGSLF